MTYETYLQRVQEAEKQRKQGMTTETSDEKVDVRPTYQLCFLGTFVMTWIGLAVGLLVGFLLGWWLM